MLRTFILLMIGPLGWLILLLEAERPQEPEQPKHQPEAQPRDWNMTHDDRKGIDA